ncbi:transposase [Pseudarthrobacter sp. S9]|uniref:transposase n=1 Tax=Pseudarthrobacter sp. S9 TaxID=3418421 RepID=UPI003CFC8E88
MTVRKKYTQQFRDEAVELVISSGRPIAQVCVDIGVNVGTLGNWVRKFREDHPERFAAGEEKTPVSWEEHQKALAEISKLKQDVEFLGKVSAFFAAKQR